MSRGQAPDVCVTSHTRDNVAGLLPDWRALHRRLGSWSPFSDPDYQLTWCHTFVARGQQRILSVRRGSSQELVAVLPLFLAPAGPLGRMVRSLHLFGALGEPLLSELPEILADPAHVRQSLAAVVGWLAQNREWDWVELNLREDQSWMEPRWVSDAGLNPAIVLHKTVFPLVVLELAPSGALPTLKRNLRETLRRSRNRIERLPGVWTVESNGPLDDEWETALGDLLRLHGARARMERKVSHPDVFDGTSQEAFLRALAGTAAEAPPRIYRLLQDGLAIAALLTFTWASRTWLSISGIAPERWDISGVTALQWEAIQSAVRARHVAVVLSTGVDTAKLRWSESVKVSHEFVIVNPRRRSRRSFEIYWLIRSHLYARRETRRFLPGRQGGGWE